MIQFVPNNEAFRSLLSVDVISNNRPDNHSVVHSRTTTDDTVCDNRALNMRIASYGYIQSDDDVPHRDAFVDRYRVYDN